MAEPTGPERERGDWTERIPGLGQLNEKNRQLVLLIGCLILIVILGIVIYLTPSTSSGSTRGDPPPTTVTTAPTGGGPTFGGADPSAEPTAPTSDPPEGSAPADQETDAEHSEHDGHDHPGTYGPDPTPIYSPTSTRSPESADSAEGKAVLEKVVPAWAEADFAAVPPDEAEKSSNPTADKRRAWVASWREEGAVKQPFVSLSSERFVALWDGAMQMSATVSDATITKSDLLWNSGGDSLWRVTVKRTVSAPGISSTEEVSWDFQVTQEGSSYALTSFAEVDPANEDPKTYRPVSR